ncbi:MAG: AI-2E family transporter [Flavisolibacter sp.]|nr:AI-2E family transporter [Flavisolibacter sp.]
MKLFRKKVLYVIRTTALVILLLWVLKEVFSVLLLLLAGTLVAMYFRGLGNIIEKHTKMPNGAALSISVIGSLLLLFGFFYLAGNSIQQQMAQIRETIPPAIEKVKASLNNSSFGRSILEKIEDEDNGKRLMTVAQSFFRSSFGILGDVYIVLFIAIFFTVGPKQYTQGFLKLFPPRKKPEAREVVQKVGYSMKRWLKGQLFAMLVVFILTAIGLIIMGMPMWLVLALSAGLLNFIPNLGPLIAMIPAVMIGFLQGPATALIVAGLYILVQMLESSLITPQIQKKMIKVPPALIIIAQLFMGVLTGGWGLLLATPLMVIIIVVVQELYIKKLSYEEDPQ